MHEIGAYSVIRLLDAWRVKCGGSRRLNQLLDCLIVFAILFSGIDSLSSSCSIVASGCVDDGQLYTP